MIQTIGIDADDTLWDEASLFQRAESMFLQTVGRNSNCHDMRERLRAVHLKIIATHGYGVTGYRLALSEFCNTEIAPDGVDAAEGLAKKLCDEIEHAQIEPLAGVSESLELMGEHARLVLITKGVEETQLDKLSRSGLANAFADVVVVREKCRRIYESVFGPAQDRPHAAMIGNSLKSDVLPALDAGAFGLHVPFGITSPLEVAEAPDDHPRFRTFETFAQAANWIVRLN